MVTHIYVQILFHVSKDTQILNKKITTTYFYIHHAFHIFQFYLSFMYVFCVTTGHLTGFFFFTSVIL